MTDLAAVVLDWMELVSTELKRTEFGSTELVSTELKRTVLGALNL